MVRRIPGWTRDSGKFPSAARRGESRGGKPRWQELRVELLRFGFASTFSFGVPPYIRRGCLGQIRIGIANAYRGDAEKTNHRWTQITRYGLSPTPSSLARGFVVERPKLKSIRQRLTVRARNPAALYIAIRNNLIQAAHSPALRASRVEEENRDD